MVYRASQAGCAAMLLWASALMPGSAAAAEACDETKDAWIEGRLGTAYLLNKQLNPIGLELEVRDCVVHLQGTVESEIDRDLAVRIAEGVEGVREIIEELGLAMAAMGEEAQRISEQKMAFRRWVDDATITADVQREIAENRNVDGESITVETEERVVILRGSVPSMSDRSMAELVARNLDGVDTVRNLLEVEE